MLKEKSPQKSAGGFLIDETILSFIKPSLSFNFRSGDSAWFLLQILYLAFIYPQIQHDRGEQRKGLRNGERIPHPFHNAQLCQQKCRGQQNDQLTEQGNQQAVDSLTHRLEESGTHNSQGSRKKAQGNDSQSRHADFQHIRGSVEDRKQHIRHQPEDKHPRPHQDKRDHTSILGRGIQTMLLSRAKVIPHNGHQALIQTEYRHKYKGLQLKVNAKEGHGGHRILREGEQNRVHSHYHPQSQWLA